MIRIFSIAFLAVIIASSCRSSKQIQSAISRKDTLTVVTGADAREDSIRVIRESVSNLYKNYIDFTSFSSKIKCDYEGGDGKKYDLNVVVRMKRDSAIWISVNAVLGIEAMRIMIDKDSVRLLNKLDKEYQVRSLDFLQEVASLPLDLRSMQDLIIGNPVFFDTSNVISYRLNGEDISMVSIGNWFRNLVTISGSSYVILNSKLDDNDQLRNRTCFLNYSDYEDLGGKYFSTGRTITVTEKTKLDVKMNFKQYAFNEMLSFPFSVPRNYVYK